MRMLGRGAVRGVAACVTMLKTASSGNRRNSLVNRLDTIGIINFAVIYSRLL
jgi:hypothetical protein